MRLTEQLNHIGRQLRIAAAIAIVCGLGVLIADSIENGFGWGAIGTVALISAAIVGGVYAYQRVFQWRKLQRRLLESRLVDEAPDHALRPFPAWMWGVWAALALVMSFSINGPFAIFFGCLLLGYGLSSPLLARNVQTLQAGRVEFYATRDPDTRRAVVVRVLAGGPDEEDSLTTGL